MKKIVLTLCALIAVIAVIALIPKQSANADFLRIHIRADSNDEKDQQVKYAVKQAVVDYLAPLLADADTKQKAAAVVQSHLIEIERVCNETLAANGFAYVSKAALKTEEFPDRCYNGVTLAAGVYDALIIELGSGKGNNWWCVVYPPLCFVEGASNGSGSIVYKSKLWEIIQKSLGKLSSFSVE